MIARIEGAMLDRLRIAGAAGLLGYGFRTLTTYPEDWDALLKDKGAMLMPAAWAVFGGFDQAEEQDEGGARVRASFGLVVAAENLRNEQATRHGGPRPNEPGSYQLMLDAAGLLIGQDFGLDIKRLQLVEARSVRPIAALEQRKVSMWAVLFRTVMPIIALDPDADPIGDFDVFHANWDIAPFGNVDADPDCPGVQLPADRTADATDHQELP
jgi:phage gp37-like protein